jgi:hypothetical protein
MESRKAGRLSGLPAAAGTADKAGKRHRSIPSNTGRLTSAASAISA